MEKKESETIKSKAQLVQWLENQCKEKKKFKIGTEHEKFLFHEDTLMPLSYEEEFGIGAILKKLSEDFKMKKILEKGKIIGLVDRNGGSISLEPGGQFELSGAPLENLHQTCNETGQHLNLMQNVFSEMQAKIKMLGIGFHPFWRKEDIFWMPKGRYKIMKNYMPKKGNLGLDMMLRSSTVQVNLDFYNERDMVRKLRTSLALQPISTALFANSPFKDNNLTGYKSYRSYLWSDTDPDRCGIPECVFEEGFGFESWIDYILEIPMYFIHRGDDYLDFSGKSFKKFMSGNHLEFNGNIANMSDFQDHLSTAFPEVRVKGYLEMRGADAGSWDNICALPAFWVGLLYDDLSLDYAEELVKDFSVDEIKLARINAAKDGLNGIYGKEKIIDIAKKALTISYDGLNRRNVTDSIGENETKFLTPLFLVVEKKMSPADDLIKKFKSEWQNDIKEVIRNNSL